MPTKDSEPDELDPTVVDSTVLDDIPTFLHETGSTLSEFQEEQPAMVMLREKLVSNYQQLLKDQVIFSPVCYRFEKVLGRGRQSTVFLGSRQGARGCVTKHALKIFDPGIYSTAEKYWTDMGRIATQLSHLGAIRSPHLVALDTYDEINGIGYIQMEWIRGKDLRYLLDGKHLELVKANSTAEEWTAFTTNIFRIGDDSLSIQPGVAVYIMRMMLKGLENLHQAGFVHSDLKPSNVMINRLGYVKLIDFGRAVKPLERVNIILGSPLYMAPELHRREPSMVQSDLYGVGMVGLEMLRGRRLFESEKLTEENLLAFKLDLPNRLSELMPAHVRENKELMNMLQQFIAPDPAKRFRSANEAETQEHGLRAVHQQLAKTGQDADYARLMGDYMNRLMDLEPT